MLLWPTGWCGSRGTCGYDGELLAPSQASTTVYRGPTGGAVSILQWPQDSPRHEAKWFLNQGKPEASGL